MTTPELNFSVVGPLVFVSIGAMLVLLGEVVLSRAKTFLGRPVTSSLVGSALAGTSIFFLAIAAYMAIVQAASGTAVAVSTVTSSAFGSSSFTRSERPGAGPSAFTRTRR